MTFRGVNGENFKSVGQSRKKGESGAVPPNLIFPRPQKINTILILVARLCGNWWIVLGTFEQ